MNMHINTTETPIACKKCFISADGSSSSANTERKPQIISFFPLFDGVYMTHSGTR